ncbi:PAS domain-containing sensor histidine kinase [Brevundimonas sp. SL130]|uniref:PAS domain-containing sensor histidine kinase n=1 Tax=Brevundimonas sp. SL130 TaxID=2995143 RepID=UPI00226CABC6|nr:PAS domain-containing protein [Brevundimonas sp. SL130]WAC60038.1 PAS domain-containing protein [Brevundimonas sp. SL130]
MFLEGEVNWALIFGIMAVVGYAIAAIALWFAVTHGARHASATDQLDMVQKVAESSDKRLFETMNAVPVAMVETDATGKFVFANRAAHQLLGRRDAELLGLRFHSATWGITFPDGKSIPADLLPSARALRGQTVRGFQHLMMNAATRKKMLVSVTAMPIENERGQVTGSIAAMVETDVLTTPAIEPAPPPPPPAGRASLADRVFDAASSALVVVDTEGRIHQANRTALIMLGRGEGVTGSDFADLFLPLDRRTEGRQALRAALSVEDESPTPIETVDADGAGIRWTLLPLTDETDRPDAILVAGVPMAEVPTVEPVAEVIEAEQAEGAPDASDPMASAIQAAQADFARREREVLAAHNQALLETMAQAEQAERAVRAELEAERRMANVGRLTGGVTHDFNALLGVMTSALDLMLRHVDEPERVRRLGQAALAAGQRGERLTRRLSAFSQDEDQTNLQRLDIGVLLSGMERKLRMLAGPAIDLMIETPAGPAFARIDPAAFEAAVLALTRNAVEASNGAGSVAVRLAVLPDEGLRLSVRDSGPGMDADTVRRAAEPFFTTRPDAAGLGLSQAFAFARQSSGALAIESAPGEGAEVSVTLPSGPGVDGSRVENQPSTDEMATETAS